MFNFLPAPLVGVVATMLMVFNVLFWSFWLFLFAVIKWILPFNAVRKRVDPVLSKIATQWIHGNYLWMTLTQKTVWQIEGAEKLNKNGWYLVNSNHQSWVDIFVLQRVLTGKIPFLKFFLKHQLIYVPIMGLAWWALDFPFMKRHSKEFLKKHPKQADADLRATQKACRKFSFSPTSVMNFMEGTRFSQEKHDRQKSPYQYLLKPKAGGIAYAIQALGDKFHSMIDVTIIYPEMAPSFWDFLSGKVKQVRVIVRELEIPKHLRDGDYQNDIECRKAFQRWVNDLWSEKDKMIDQAFLNENPASS